MSILNWLGIGSSATQGVNTLAQTADSIASKWISNPAERQTEVNKLMQAAQTDLESARSTYNALPGDTGFSAFADGINKLVRPILAVGVIAILYKWWPAPDLSKVPAWMQSLGFAVFGYYFGVVSLFHDLPRGASTLIKIIKG